MKWIINRKKFQPGSFLGALLVMTAEMSLLNVCVLLFRIAATSRETDWYSSAIQLEVSTDVFASDRGNAIFVAMTVAVLAVVLFLIISSCMFKRFQLERMSSEISVFSALGYESGKIRDLLWKDAGMDIVITVPFAMYVSTRLLRVLEGKEEFQVMFSSIRIDGFSMGIQYLFCILFMYVLLGIYQDYWIHKETKKGIGNMMEKEN